MNTKENDIVATGKTKRILTLDLLRGYFLLVIMVGHIELYPNGWDFFTGKGRLLVSAAEGFFFMAGLLIGMVYRRRLAQGMRFIFKKMWARAAQLYVAGFGLTILFLAWVELSGRAPIKDSLPETIPWGHYIEQALLMRFTYGWADFLVRFAILMFFAPFVFYLISKGKWWLMLAVSLMAWYFRGESFTLGWQLIFNLGILAGFYWFEIEKRYRGLSSKRRGKLNKAFIITALITFTLSYASVYVLSLLNNLYDSLTPWLRHLTFTWNNYNSDVWVYAQKWTMGPLRVLLFFIWFPVLYAIFRRYEKPIGRYSRGVLEMLGRNSLFVYTAHAFIVFALKLYFIPPATSFIENFLFTGVGLALLIAVTQAYTKLLRPKLSRLELPKLKFLKSGS